MAGDDTGSERQLVALVQCGKEKRDLPDGETCPAKDLYTGPYFRNLWEYAETFANRQYILSAEHYLLGPEEEIEPYDASLSPRYDSYIGQDGVEEWGRMVGGEIKLGRWKKPWEEVVVLAGRDYIEPITEELQYLIEHGVPVYDPFFDCGGLPGQRKWLNKALDAGEPMLPESDDSDDGGAQMRTSTSSEPEKPDSDQSTLGEVA